MQIRLFYTTLCLWLLHSTICLGQRELDSMYMEELRAGSSMDFVKQVLVNKHARELIKDFNAALRNAQHSKSGNKSENYYATDLIPINLHLEEWRQELVPYIKAEKDAWAKGEVPETLVPAPERPQKLLSIVAEQAWFHQDTPPLQRMLEPFTLHYERYLFNLPPPPDDKKQPLIQGRTLRNKEWELPLPETAFINLYYYPSWGKETLMLALNVTVSYELYTGENSESEEIWKSEEVPIIALLELRPKNKAVGKVMLSLRETRPANSDWQDDYPGAESIPLNPNSNTFILAGNGPGDKTTIFNYTPHHQKFKNRSLVFLAQKSEDNPMVTLELMPANTKENKPPKLFLLYHGHLDSLKTDNINIKNLALPPNIINTASQYYAYEFHFGPDNYPPALALDKGSNKAKRNQYYVRIKREDCQNDDCLFQSQSLFAFAKPTDIILADSSFTTQHLPLEKAWDLEAAPSNKRERHQLHNTLRLPYNVEFNLKGNEYFKPGHSTVHFGMYPLPDSSGHTSYTLPAFRNPSISINHKILGMQITQLAYKSIPNSPSLQHIDSSTLILPKDSTFRAVISKNNPTFKPKTTVSITYAKPAIAYTNVFHWERRNTTAEGYNKAYRLPASAFAHAIEPITQERVDDMIRQNTPTLTLRFNDTGWATTPRRTFTLSQTQQNHVLLNRGGSDSLSLTFSAKTDQLSTLETVQNNFGKYGASIKIVSALKKFEADLKITFTLDSTESLHTQSLIGQHNHGTLGRPLDAETDSFAVFWEPNISVTIYDSIYFSTGTIPLTVEVNNKKQLNRLPSYYHNHKGGNNSGDSVDVTFKPNEGPIGANLYPLRNIEDHRLVLEISWQDTLRLGKKMQVTQVELDWGDATSKTALLPAQNVFGDTVRYVASFGRSPQDSLRYNTPAFQVIPVPDTAIFHKDMLDLATNPSDTLLKWRHTGASKYQLYLLQTELDKNQRVTGTKLYTIYDTLIPRYDGVNDTYAINIALLRKELQKRTTLKQDRLHRYYFAITTVQDSLKNSSDFSEWEAQAKQNPAVDLCRFIPPQEGVISLQLVMGLETDSRTKPGTVDSTNKSTERILKTTFKKVRYEVSTGYLKQQQTNIMVLGLYRYPLSLQPNVGSQIKMEPVYLSLVDVFTGRTITIDIVNSASQDLGSYLAEAVSRFGEFDSGKAQNTDAIDNKARINYSLALPWNEGIQARAFLINSDSYKENPAPFLKQAFAPFTGDKYPGISQPFTPALLNPDKLVFYRDGTPEENSAQSNQRGIKP